MKTAVNFNSCKKYFFAIFSEYKGEITRVGYAEDATGAARKVLEYQAAHSWATCWAMPC